MHRMEGDAFPVVAQSLFSPKVKYSEPVHTQRTLTMGAVMRAHKQLHLNPAAVSHQTLMEAMRVELEHGSKYGPLANVTDDNILKTAQIALAHLMEFRDYYDRLQKMECEAKAYWEARAQHDDFVLPDLFLE